MKNRGVMLVVLLLGAGVAAAVAAVWSQYRQTRHALEFWGSETAALIETAPTVELVELPIDADLDLESFFSNRPALSTQPIDISRARGLVHFRRSLLVDANFVWDDAGNTARVSAVRWSHAVQFASSDASVVVVFDLPRKVAANRAAAEHTAILSERMARGFEKFFAEQISKAPE